MKVSLLFTPSLYVAIVQIASTNPFPSKAGVARGLYAMISLAGY